MAMSEDNRTARRDKQRHAKRHGMRVSGRSVFSIARAILNQAPIVYKAKPDASGDWMVVAVGGKHERIVQEGLTEIKARKLASQLRVANLEGRNG